MKSNNYKLIFLILWALSIFYGFYIWFKLIQPPLLIWIFHPFFPILLSIPLYKNIKSNLIRKIYYFGIILISSLGILFYLSSIMAPLGFVFGPFVLFLSYLLLLIIVGIISGIKLIRKTPE